MLDAQGELAARQSHLPKIRDDRKFVDRHEQIGLRYGSRSSRAAHIANEALLTIVAAASIHSHSRGDHHEG
jgi:hypothetical protein